MRKRTKLAVAVASVLVVYASIDVLNAMLVDAPWMQLSYDDARALVGDDEPFYSIVEMETGEVVWEASPEEEREIWESR